MSLKVPCDIEIPLVNSTSKNKWLGNRSYADVVKTGALGDHTYCDTTFQCNVDKVNSALMEHDYYYYSDSEFPNLDNPNQQQKENTVPLFDHANYTCDPIQLPKFAYGENNAEKPQSDDHSVNVNVESSEKTGKDIALVDLSSMPELAGSQILINHSLQNVFSSS